MEAFDPRTAVPERWSLKPEDTHSLVFWTKDPRNLLLDRHLLKPYQVKVHMTITGWEEVEKGAPLLKDALWMLEDAVMVFGAENVTWRFSPVPVVENVVERFSRIALVAGAAKIKTVFLSFLQPNDMVPETRSTTDRACLAGLLTEIGNDSGLLVRLCNDDSALNWFDLKAHSITKGVCVPCEGDPKPAAEKCGCAIMVDPFTINETCTMGCTYCYAADKTLADKKRNSTKGLPVVR
jgi:hypothetical protein